MAAVPDTKTRIGRPAGVITDVRREVEMRWARGDSAAQIAKAVGWTAANPYPFINTYRSRGWALPIREGNPRTSCPTCKAKPGDYCVMKSGRPLARPHAERKGTRP